MLSECSHNTIDFQKLRCMSCQKAIDLSKIGINYYALFGIEEKIQVDPKTLRKAYFSALAACHPDQNQDAEVALSFNNSSIVNHAYKTLQDPLLAAEHLLNFYNSTSFTPVLEPEFMMLTMEWNDSIEQENTQTEIRTAYSNELLNLETKITQKAFSEAFNSLGKLKTLRNLLR